MRKMLKYLEETPEDKQLRQVLISMIGSILLCIACLAGSTWAWFQTTLTSENNVITLAEMRVAVTLSKGEVANRHNLVATDLYTYKLEEVGSYDIVLINNGTIPGYCTIRLTDQKGHSEVFTSGTLYPAEEGKEDAATITIEITAEDKFNEILPVELKITPHWGDDPTDALMSIDEELFLPTEETTDETESTEECTEATEATEETAGTTEATQETTESTQPPETTQETEPEETTEPSTEPAETEDSNTPAPQSLEEEPTQPPEETAEATQTP